MSWDKFEKLVELLKRRITQVVLFKLKDPRVGFITITRIKLSRDLKDCEVFYSVFGSKGDLSKTAAALEDARGFVQNEVAKAMRTRTMPKLRFSHDDTLEKIERMHKIFDTIREESEEDRKLPPDGEEPSDQEPAEPERE